MREVANEKTLTVWSLLVVVGISFSLIIAAYPNYTAEPASANLYSGWERAWVSHLDNTTYASMNNVELIRDELDPLNDDRMFIKVLTSTSTMYLLNITNGKITYNRRVPGLVAPSGGENIFSIFSSGDQRFIVSLTNRDEAQVRDLVSGEATRVTLDYIRDPVPVSIAVSSTGRYIVVGDRNGILIFTLFGNW